MTSLTLAKTIANIGSIVRVWDNTPNTAIVPCMDDAGKRFELVFDGDAKDLFDKETKPAFDALTAGLDVPTLPLTVVGTWKKRMWKKTRTSGGWGHTWQFHVLHWAHATADGVTLCLGDIPADAIVQDAGILEAA